MTFFLSFDGAVDSVVIKRIKPRKTQIPLRLPEKSAVEPWLASSVSVSTAKRIKDVRGMIFLNEMSSRSGDGI